MENSDAGKEDLDLLQGLRRRDKEALGLVSERYGAFLMRTSYLFLGDRDAADDVVQETLIAVWDSVGRMPSDLKLRSWLFGILLNKCRMYRRSFWRRLKLERRVGKPHRIEDRRDGNESDRLESLRLALQQLDENLRTVLILRYEHGFDIAETAAALGLPEGTVKSRTHLAIEKMKRWMEKNHE
jgi:RNA polymerase sigma-70 factor (ECF subfamily)